MAPMDLKSTGGFATLLPGEQQPCGVWHPLCLNDAPRSCNKNPALQFCKIPAMTAHGKVISEGGEESSRASLVFLTHHSTKTLYLLGTQNPLASSYLHLCYLL